MGINKLIRYGLPFSNVVASGTATNNITPGRTLDKLTLKLGGTSLTKAMLSNIKIKANGKVIVEGTGTQLEAINAYSGKAANAAYLDIMFYNERLLSEFDRAVSAFDTSVGVANITSEVTIAGATAPQLTPILTESAAQKDRAGAAAPFAPLLRKLLTYPFSIASGGTLPFTVPFGPQSGAVIKRVFVFHTGTMTGATVKQDGLVIHESLQAENEFMQTQFGRVPQSNCYCIDFCVDGNIRKALDTRDAKSLEWLLTFSAASNGTIIVEYLDTLGNI